MPLSRRCNKMNVFLSGVKRIVNTIRFTESKDPYQFHTLSLSSVPIYFAKAA